MASYKVDRSPRRRGGLPKGRALKGRETPNEAQAESRQVDSIGAQDWVFYGALAPIVLASFVGLGFALERFAALREKKVLPRNFLIEFEDLIHRKAFEEARTLCRKTDAPLSRLLAVVAEHAGKPRAAIKERVQEMGQFESALLERGIGVVATVGSVSPLLGLLGTVVGMVLIFRQATGGDTLAAPEQLAAGISTALYTTVLGLAVAIPAVISARYLSGRAQILSGEMEEHALRFLDEVAAD